MLDQYKKNSELEKIIYNKSIALVGPSGHLVNKGLGAYIDSFDIICRVNDVSIKNYEEDYGYKTDLIVYSCPTLGQDDFLNRLMMSSNVSVNVKGLICPTTKADHLYRDSPEENFKKINMFNIPFFYEGKENYNLLCKEVGTELSMGIAAIITMLVYQPKLLFITGYSFYHNFDNTKSLQEKYDSVYYPGCVMPQHQKETMHPFRGHNQEKQKEYFKNIILTRYSSITQIDSLLESVLNIDYHNVK